MSDSLSDDPQSSVSHFLEYWMISFHKKFFCSWNVFNKFFTCGNVQELCSILFNQMETIYAQLKREKEKNQVKCILGVPVSVIDNFPFNIQLIQKAFNPRKEESLLLE